MSTYYHNYKYAAFLASGEILETDDFKVIYRAARFRVRDDANAAAIRRNSDDKIVAYLLEAFGVFQVLRPDELHPNMVKFIKSFFELEPTYGLFCWEEAHK